MLKKNMSVRPAAWRDTHIRSLRRVDAAALAATLVLTQLVRFGFEQEALRLGQLTMPYWLVGAVLGCDLAACVAPQAEMVVWTSLRTGLGSRVGRALRLFVMR